MCGFGDSWVQASTNQDEDAYPFIPNREQVQLPPGLLIFIKNPEKGKVKTRLAGDIGEEKALQWYMHMLNHTRETVRQVEASRYLYYSKFIDEKDEWNSEEFSKKLQPGGDLGNRMSKAFEEAFAAGHQRVLIIGSDCLDLRVHHLRDAVEALQNHDFVIGPANDGGYYLLGMRQYTPEIFQGIAWSTESVFSETTKSIEKLGKTYATLEELVDVDYESDLLAALNRPDSATE